METLEHRLLGATGETVSVLGVGMWPLVGGGLPEGVDPPDRDLAVATIHEALNLGVTLFDTAPTYGWGEADELLSRALGSRRDDIFLTSKCGQSADPERRFDSRPASIIGHVEGSLNRLRTDVIDLLLVHWPDRTVDPADVMETLHDLRSSGKVRYIGVSNFTRALITDYLPHGEISACQIPYNLFDRRIEGDYLELCDRHGIAAVGYGALAHGLLAGHKDVRGTLETLRSVWGPNVLGLPLLTEANLPRNVDVVTRLIAFADELEMTLPQLAIAWTVRNRQPAAALVGPRTPDEVRDCVLGAERGLGPEELGVLDEVLAGAAGTETDLSTADPKRLLDL